MSRVLGAGTAGIISRSGVHAASALPHVSKVMGKGCTTDAHKVYWLTLYCHKLQLLRTGYSTACQLCRLCLSGASKMFGSLSLVPERICFHSTADVRKAV